MTHRHPFAVLALLATPIVAHAQVDGVDATSITVGQPAAFSGPSAGLGIELWRGVEARKHELNDAGGINGRELKVALCVWLTDADSNRWVAVDDVGALAKQLVKD